MREFLTSFPSFDVQHSYLIIIKNNKNNRGKIYHWKSSYEVRIWPFCDDFYIYIFAYYLQKSLKDMKKSLKEKCLTRTCKKTSHITWTLYIKLWAICLYNLYKKYKVHVIWLVFLQVRVKHSPWGISSFLLVAYEPRHFRRELATFLTFVHKKLNSLEHFFVFFHKW